MMIDEDKTRSQLLDELHRLRIRVAELEGRSAQGLTPSYADASGEALDIINSSPLVVFVWRDEEGWPVEFVTDNVVGLLGYNAVEMMSGQVKYGEIVHPEDLARVEREVADYGKKEGCEGLSHEPYRIIAKDGSVRWVKDETRLKRGEMEGLGRYQGVVQDITQRKQIEEALLESQSRLSDAQKLAGLGYWQWDVNTGEVHWSEEVYQIFQLDPELFIPRIDSIMKLSPWPQHNQRDQELIQQAIDRKEKGEYDQKFLRPDGSIGYYHSTFMGEYDSDDNLTSMHGTVMDITERKEREAELQKLRSYLSNIIDSMPSILIAVDREGKVTQWNNQTEQATGMDFEQAQAQPLDQVCPRLADEMERIKKSIRERRVINSPKVARKQEQETRYESITIYPLVANGVDGAVIRVDDITEQVRLQEMMVQSEKMLSVGGLAAGMAHEINNPLAGMMQTADVMKSRMTKLDMPANLRAAEAVGLSLEQLKAYMEDREIVRMIETIHESGKRVAAIVENMLSFARKSEATVLPQRLGDLLDRTVELAATDYDLKKQYDFKRIEIHREYAANMPDVPCERAKIQQVLLNLLRNGAEAMQTHGTESPRFVLRTGWDADRRMAVIEIEDNGPGMDEETCKRVFEPFFTSKPVGVGTGLGLSVSYFIITENHHGTMAVESSPGLGAKFIIQLPAE